MTIVYVAFDVYMPISAINISAVCTALGNSPSWCLAHPPAVFARIPRLFAMHVYFENSPALLISNGAADASVLLRTYADLEEENYISVICADFPGTTAVTYVSVTLIFIAILLLMCLAWWLTIRQQGGCKCPKNSGKPKQ